MAEYISTGWPDLNTRGGVLRQEYAIALGELLVFWTIPWELQASDWVLPKSYLCGDTHVAQANKKVQ